MDEWSQTEHHETRHESGRRKYETMQILVGVIRLQMSISVTVIQGADEINS